MFDMPFHGPRQHRAFHITAGVNAVFQAGCVIDTRDVLLDDGSFVQLSGDVMCGGTDELDPAIVRLLVRPCALETRKERVVNVDGPALKTGSQLG